MQRINQLALLFLLTASATYADTVGYALHGVPDKLKKPLQTQLDETIDALGKDPSPEKITGFHNKAPEQITQFLQAAGYFNASVKTTLRRKEEFWLMTVNVKPAAPVRIHSLQLLLTGAGKRQTILQRYRQQFPLRASKIFDSKKYEEAKNTWQRQAAQIGFLDAQYTKHEVNIDEKQHTANINLTLNTGKRYYFGPTLWKQKDFSPKFLNRFVEFKQGEPFASDKVLALQQDLMQSGYFQQVVIQADKQKAKRHKIPVHVELTPRKSQAYTFGLGYSTDVGPRASTGITLRRLNRYGHHADMQIQASQVKNQIHGRYVIPGSNPITDAWVISAAAFNDDTPKGDSHTYQAGLAYTYTRHYWQNIYSINYQFDHSRLKGKPYQDLHLILPGATWRYHVTDHPIFPMKADFLDITLRGTSKSLGSNSSFWQAIIESKAIRPIGSRGRGVVRAEVATSQVNHLNDVPISLQLLTGGSQSVRGYAYQSLGPGRYLGVASAEYQYRLFGKWYAAAFYDIGNAFNRLSGPDWQRGVGGGLIWVSPLGPIQVSMARALDKKNKPWRLVLSLGTSF